MSFINKAGALVLGLSFVVGTNVAMARDRDDHNKCENKVRKAEQKLQRDEQKHGRNSRQAEKDRENLEHARQHCDMNGGHDRDHDNDRH